METSQTIQKAVEILHRESPSGSKVILFGSQARGDATPRSDIDLLVIEPEVEDRFLETNRLSRALRWMRVPLDLIVLSREAYDEWREVPGTLAYRVAREGRVVQ